MENKTVTASNVLTWGIIALVFCWTPIVGLVLAIIARKKAKTYGAENNGEITGQAKVGQIFSIIALVASIVAIVYWAIYIAGIAALSSLQNAY
ncbi:MAG: hypothetical protein IJT18_05000 [Oscillospiraceae bacterium]|nr:hypothetical protein [Oscillospiraceae bacterium]